MVFYNKESFINYFDKRRFVKLMHKKIQLNVNIVLTK